MTKHVAGEVCWAQDPTNAHPERPVVVLSHEGRPYSSVECTVMCLGHGSAQHDHDTPELTSNHLSGISFGKATYLMPWALYTIPPADIQNGRANGTLTDEGKRLVKRELIRLLD